MKWGYIYAISRFRVSEHGDHVGYDSYDRWVCDE